MQGTEDKVMHKPAFAEAHFMLCWVHVHVYQGGIELKIEHITGVATAKEHVRIGLANRMSNQLVANDTAIHKEVLLVGLTARIGRQPDPAPKSKPRGLCGDIQMNRLFNKT